MGPAASRRHDEAHGVGDDRRGAGAGPGHPRPAGQDLRGTRPRVRRHRGAATDAPASTCRRRSRSSRPTRSIRLGWRRSPPSTRPSTGRSPTRSRSPSRRCTTSLTPVQRRAVADWMRTHRPGGHGGIRSREAPSVLGCGGPSGPRVLTHGRSPSGCAPRRGRRPPGRDGGRVPRPARARRHRRRDGERGLAALRRGRFDVVLLDVMLPGVDGLEVCRRIRAAPEWRRCRS